MIFKPKRRQLSAYPDSKADNYKTHSGKTDVDAEDGGCQAFRLNWVPFCGIVHRLGTGWKERKRDAALRNFNNGKAGKREQFLYLARKTGISPGPSGVVEVWDDH
ncbi:hypothetical protein CMUS01_12895 [Colletotrichum musicola]|uniref:Uncharacterized protein n=1 Tax=Colletotrichum musicola TaxID=2175873 RepID=A0A8H6JI97_9PEZI|nr:hypothetical protein CMUS01_12895 [Colletotrichum musicola]